jgi:demethylmenaquinone methyltransferase / 2-methoxy-6-polyprenyl-1,4-benzoquinol methylase
MLTERPHNHGEQPTSGDRCPPLCPPFGFNDHPGGRSSFVARLFDETASEYDRIEGCISLGTGAWYRGRALERAGLVEGMYVVDVAIGTGLVAREALRIVGPTGAVLGVDPSSEMRRRAEAGVGISTLEGIAEALPVDDGVAHFVTMGYALRHVADLNMAFAEFRRVLRPGGRFCILEITRPKTVFGRLVLRNYLTWMPTLATATRRGPSRVPELWRYYWDTIDRCVPPAAIERALSRAGFEEVRHGASFGIFSEFTGVCR